MKRFEIYTLQKLHYSVNLLDVNFGSFRFLLIVIDYIVYYNKTQHKILRLCLISGSKGSRKLKPWS